MADGGAGARRVAALNEVMDATRALFHQMKAAAREVHGGSELTAGLRGVLQELHRKGPRTVPQMARARPVSRQNIQTLVNGLLDEGLVELRDNPAHARSRLVALTPAGRRRVRAMLGREARILERLPVAAEARELAAAARALRAVRTAFRGPMWEEILETELEEEEEEG